jgi:hypothetical protein
MQPAEDVSQREELESLKAKLLEMQQSYNESQRTVAELRAHNASLQSDKQQAQETLGLEKLKLSEAGKAREIAEEQHKSTLDERDTALAKAVEEKKTAELGRDSARKVAQDQFGKRMAAAFEKDAALAKAVELEKTADDRVSNALKVHNEMADKRAAHWQASFEEAETKLAIAKEDLDRTNKSNAKIAAEVAAEFLESTQKLESWRKKLIHCQFKLEQAESSEGKASRKVEPLEARQAAPAAKKGGEDFYTELLEHLQKSKFNQDGMNQFHEWYASTEGSRPKGLPPSLGQPVYTEAQARTIHEQGRLVGHYEAEVCADLRAVVKWKMQRKVENFAKRTEFFKDETHRLHPVKLGREAAELIASVQAAKKKGRPDLDKRVLKPQQTPEVYSRLTREERTSKFWDAFETAAVKVAIEAGLGEPED